MIPSTTASKQAHQECGFKSPDTPSGLVKSNIRSNLNSIQFSFKYIGPNHNKLYLTRHSSYRAGLDHTLIIMFTERPNN